MITYKEYTKFQNKTSIWQRVFAQHSQRGQSPQRPENLNGALVSLQTLWRRGFNNGWRSNQPINRTCMFAPQPYVASLTITSEGKMHLEKIEQMCWRCLHLYFVGTLEECEVTSSKGLSSPHYFVDMLNIEGGHDRRSFPITFVMKQLAIKIPSSSTSFLSLLLSKKLVMNCNSPKVHPLTVFRFCLRTQDNLHLVNSLLLRLNILFPQPNR